MRLVLLPFCLCGFYPLVDPRHDFVDFIRFYENCLNKVIANAM